MQQTRPETSQLDIVPSVFASHAEFPSTIKQNDRPRYKEKSESSQYGTRNASTEVFVEWDYE